MGKLKKLSCFFVFNFFNFLPFGFNLFLFLLFAMNLLAMFFHNFVDFLDSIFKCGFSRFYF